MQPAERLDRVRLRHMMDAAEEAVAFAQGRTRADLASDRMFALAVVKLIEIVGEAASKVSPEGREAVTDIPWRDVVAMRNILVHGYFEIDFDLVWDTVSDDLPPLIEAVRTVLKL